jgi:putative ATP-dependent endonuclease of OLD family
MTANDKLIIEGIKLKNYKSFKEFPEEGFLKIRNFTTIIGKNDIGKSNLLKALKVILEDENISKTDFHKNNINEPCEITIKFKVPDTLRKKEGIRDFIQDGFIVLTKKFTFNNSNNKVNSKYLINNQDIKTLGLNLKNLKPFIPKSIFIPAVKNPEDEIKFQKGTIISELLLPIIEESSEEKENTKSVKRLTEELTNLINEKAKEITKDLLEMSKQFWEDIENINIKVEDFKLQKAFTPKVKIKDKYLNHEIDLMNRGNGFQRYFILSLLEVYRKRKIGKGFVLLFEEPEIYLHFGAQRKLLNILKDFSQEGQVIITTHSPIFIDRTSIQSIYLFYKKNGETKFKYIKEDIAYILEELEFTPSDVFLSDYLIFVEGPTEVKIFKELFRNLNDFREYNVSFLHMGGGDNIKHFLDNTIEDLKSINPNVAIILDGDKYNAYSNITEVPIVFTKKDNKIVKTIENLFSEKAIKEILGIEIKIDENTDVPYLIEQKKRQKEGNPNWKYNKEKFGKKIIKWMIENNDPNLEYFKQLFKEVFENFEKRQLDNE